MFAAHNGLFTGAAPKLPVTYKGSNYNPAGTTVTIPSHSVGDIIIIAAYTTITGIAKPSSGGTVPNWVDIDTSSYWYTGYYVATATNTTSGSWDVSMGGLTAVVLSGQGATPIGGHAIARSPGTTVTAPSVTLAKTDGSSQLLQIGMHEVGNRVYNNTFSTSGYTQRINNYNGRLITKDATTSDGSLAVGTLDGSGYWGATTIEIRT